MKYWRRTIDECEHRPAARTAAALWISHQFLISGNPSNLQRLNWQEKDLAAHGITLRRSIMSNWVIRFSMEYFLPIVSYMGELLKKQEYNQCDETVLQVINDGRGPNTKSYMWVHTSSELLKDHPISAFCYEPTRSTEHLRKFYGSDIDYILTITSDSFAAYFSYESENSNVTVSLCMMHCRRRFVEALHVLIRGGKAWKKFWIHRKRKRSL